MDLDTQDKLTATLVTGTGSAYPLTTAELTVSKYSIDVYSQLVNYKQTVEAIYPSGYVTSQNKILVDAARYAELKVGDYLKAYVDPATLETGEVGRNLTRILTKRVYPGDSTLVELSCDARIDVTNVGTEIS